MTEPATSGATETILLVEDQRDVRAFVRTALEGRGYTILEAAEGEEALAVASRHQGPIHLLLTDILMPTMDGTRLAGRIRMRYPSIRILYMSGYNDVAVLHSRHLLSNESFLQKPFSPQALFDKVRESLEAGAGGPGSGS